MVLSTVGIAVWGAMATAILAGTQELKGVIGPADNATGATVIDPIEIIPVQFLAEAAGVLTDGLPLKASRVEPLADPRRQRQVRRGRRRCQRPEPAKRTHTIAAAGHHDLLTVGLSGTRKTVYEGLSA